MPVSVSYDKTNATTFDRIFCLMSKKYRVPKLMLKALAIRESALRPDAYRYEPKFWEKYLKDNPEWEGEDPALVSASWGLCQLMYVVAVELGFKKGRTGEELCDPVVNIELAAKKLRLILDTINKHGVCIKHYPLHPLCVALSRYNAGGKNNPSDSGILKSQKYINGILKTWQELQTEEEECDNAV